MEDSEPTLPPPSLYSLEGWPVPADSVWRRELDAIKDTHTIAPLVAYLLTSNDDYEPIPPNKYSEVIPGALVHVKFTLTNRNFSGKTIMVANIEELIVLQRAPSLPPSPAKKRFMDMTKQNPGSHGPAKRTRSQLAR